MLELNYKVLGVKRAMAVVIRIPPKLQEKTLAVGRRTALASLVYYGPGGMGKRVAWGYKANVAKGFVDIFSTSYSKDVIKFMEFGTRPHMIFPKTSRAWMRGLAGVLRFTVNGKVVFARSVAHPGTKPYKMIEHAAQDAALSMRAVAERYMPETSWEDER